MSRPDTGVELLERALAYTRGALLHVRPTHLARPTPCAGWTLDHLLDHMDDALDAFVEGADGAIAVDPPHRPLDVRVGTLQLKACALLGAWSSPRTPATVLLGGLRVPTGVVTRAAALEITTHGWDVARATGHAAPLPPDLARALHPVAQQLVGDADRGDLFGPAREVADGAGPGERLLAHLGRSPHWRPDPTDLADLADPTDLADLTGPLAPVSSGFAQSTDAGAPRFLI